MICPHLEETSALFDGRDVDRTHADSCDECRAFLADAVQLRDSLVILSAAKDPLPRRRIAPILIPIALMLCIVLVFFLRNERTKDTGPFAGLDGGGRAVIAVKDAP